MAGDKLDWQLTSEVGRGPGCSLVGLSPPPAGSGSDAISRSEPSEVVGHTAGAPELAAAGGGDPTVELGAESCHAHVHFLEASGR